MPILTAYVQKVEHFMDLFGSVLPQILRLDMDVTEIESSFSDPQLLTIFKDIITACPSVTHLTTRGDVGDDILRTFGSSCASLNQLNVVGSVRTLHTSGLFLPYLTSTTATLRMPQPLIKTQQWSSSVFSSTLSEQLPGCTAVTSICIKGGIMTDMIWKAAPDGLQSLGCQLGEKGGPEDDSRKLNKLQCLTVLDGVDTLLGPVAMILKSAPQLRVITASVLHVQDNATASKDLEVLNQALEMGLHIVRNSEDGRARDEATASDDFRLEVGRQRCDKERGCEVFVHGASHAERQRRGGGRFTGIYPSVHNIATDVGPSFISEYVDAFPKMYTLRLDGRSLWTDSELQLLAPCSSLQALFISNCALVTARGLGELCLLIPTLTWLRIHNCDRVPAALALHYADEIRKLAKRGNTRREIDVEVVPVATQAQNQHRERMLMDVD